MPSWMKWGIALLIGFAIIVVGFRWAGWLLRSFFIMNCLVLMIVVLLQSGKAADLAGAFGGAGSQTAFGPRGAATILSQATTWCAIMFMICAMALVVNVDKSVESGGSVLQQTSRGTAKKPAAPVTPAPPPQTPAPQPTTPQSSIPAAPTPQGSTPASTSSPAPAKQTSQPPAAPQPKKP